MFVCCAISQYNLALFHLINHAFFKSLLFLSAGAIIHALNDNQDIRKMGGIINQLPITYIAFLLGSLSLVAFPFFTGFYSKDFLLTLLLTPHSFSHTIAYLLTFIAAIFTSLYSIRVLMIVFLSSPNYPYRLRPYITDSGILMSTPLIILTTLAVIIGCLTQFMYLDYGSEFYRNGLYISP